MTATKRRVFPTFEELMRGLSYLQTLCEPCNQGKADRAPHPHDLRPVERQP